MIDMPCSGTLGRAGLRGAGWLWISPPFGGPGYLPRERITRSFGGWDPDSCQIIRVEIRTGIGGFGSVVKVSSPEPGHGCGHAGPATHSPRVGTPPKGLWHPCPRGGRVSPRVRTSAFEPNCAQRPTERGEARPRTPRGTRPGLRTYALRQGPRSRVHNNAVHDESRSRINVPRA